MLFSPNQGHLLTDIPPQSKYTVRNSDGSSTIVRGFAPASSLRYSDVSLTAQIRDGVRLPETSVGSFLTPSIEERVNTLEHLVNILSNETQHVD